MSAIETGLYVAVGAVDLAGEKIRDLPAMKELVERTSKIRETSLIEQAREIEPKVRKQAKELQARGEDVVARIRKEVPRNLREFGENVQKQTKDFPAEARKQLQELPEKLQELPETARKQAIEFRENVQKRFGREAAKPAPKTTGTKATANSTPKATASKTS
jgi:mRNA-degrading endonuclease RelE of RelBE toxin-antitoxin system